MKSRRLATMLALGSLSMVGCGNEAQPSLESITSETSTSVRPKLDKSITHRRNYSDFGDFVYNPEIRRKRVMGVEHAPGVNSAAFSITHGWEYQVKPGDLTTNIARQFNEQDDTEGDFRYDATVENVYRLIRNGTELDFAGDNIRPGETIYIIMDYPRSETKRTG